MYFCHLPESKCKITPIIPVFVLRVKGVPCTGIDVMIKCLRMYLGIDIGGTKTLIATFDSKGTLLERHKFPTPVKYLDFLRELSATVANMSTKKWRAGCVAFPGLIDREKGIGIVCGNLPWRNVPIAHDITKIVKCPLLIENDANLAGLSEAMLLPKYDRVLYVTISTGIGTGIIVDRTIDPEFQDSEGGHMILEHNGRRQQWEDFASGSAIVRRFGKKASEINDAKTWRSIAKNIATGLLDLSVVIRPQVVVLGGGVSNYLERFKPYLLEEMEHFATPLTPLPIIKKAANPNDAVIIGCYYLAKKHA